MSENIEPDKEDEIIAELKVFKQEDRKTVAGILFDNGYTVRQGKKQRTPTGKTVDYTIIIADNNGINTK